MRTTTTTDLRKHLFSLLDAVEQGETVSVTRGGRVVARLCPAEAGDWRARMTRKPRLLVPPDEAFAPMDDLWEDYA